MTVASTMADRRNALMACTVIGGGVAAWMLGSQRDWPQLIPQRALPALLLAGLLVGALLWWLTRSRADAGKGSEADAHRITGIAITVLGGIAALSGLATLIVVQGELRANAEQRLGDMALNQSAVFAHSLSQEVELVQGVTKQWGLKATVARLNDHRGDQQARRHLREVAAGIGTHGFTALEIYAVDGQPLFEQGDMRIGRAAVRLPLQGKHIQLLWDNGLVLHSRMVIGDPEHRLGMLVTEMRLNTLTHILRNLQRTGDSTDVMLCGMRWTQAVCMPSRFHAGNHHIPMEADGRAVQPIAMALGGQSGTATMQDLRGVAVQAGYAPLAGFELGLAVKTDVDEVHAPVRAKLHEALAVMIAVVACGTWLLRSRMAPLARQLTAERKSLMEILATTHDAFAALDGEGRIVAWNAQAEKMFGWTRDEALGMPITSLLSQAQENGAALADTFRRLGCGGVIASAQRAELSAMHRNGSVFPIGISVSPTTHSRPHRYSVFMHDISQHQHAQRLLAEREKRLRDVTNSVPALIGHFDLNEVCTFANDRALRVLGLARTDLPGLTLRAALGEDNYRQHEPGVRKALAGQAAVVEGHIPYKGRTAYFQVHLVPDKDEHNQVRGFYLMTFDVSQLKESELKLARGKQRLRTITDNLPVLISYIDENLCFQFANGTFKEWLDVDPDALRGQHVASVIGEPLFQQRKEQMVQALRGQKIAFEIESEARGIRRHLQTTYLPDFRADGSVAGIYTLSTDITKLKRIEQRLLLLARFDTLTGLPNRRQLEEKLPEAMARCARSGRPMALMFLDIDKFKTINDTLGHAAGDEVLKEFAQRLLSCTRRTDLVARLAGDEFVVVLEGLNTTEEPRLVAEKIIATVCGSDFDVLGRGLPVSTSLGIALYEGEGGISGLRLLTRADEALYEAKEAGRGTFRFAVKETLKEAPKGLPKKAVRDLAQQDTARDTMAEPHR